jgi:hypothetical protein
MKTDQKCVTFAQGHNHNSPMLHKYLVSAKLKNVQSTFVHSEDVVGTGHDVIRGHFCAHVHSFGACMLKHHLAANLTYSSSPSSAMQISQFSLAPSAGRTSSSGEFCSMKTSFSAPSMARRLRALVKTWPHRGQLRSPAQLVVCMISNRIATESRAGKSDVAAGLAQKFRRAAIGQS